MAVINSDRSADTTGGARSTDSPLLGMAAAVAAFFCLNVMSLFAKLLSDTHHVVDIAFWRNLIALLPFFVTIVILGRWDTLKIHSNARVIIIRSLVGTLNILLVFGAFSLLPMAHATALIFASSLFTPVLGFLVLGEHVGPYRWSAVIVGFAGVLIVAQPGADASWSILGVALGLAAACVNSTLGLMLRVLGRSETPETMTFYFLLIGAVMLAPTMPFVATMPARDEILLLLGLGFSGALMQIFMSTAFKYAPAALVSPITYTQIVWATLFGWTIFGDFPTRTILIGSAIIIVSSLIVLLRERHLARKGRLARPPIGE
jgi:drug/metabolite transporter (DMT)-like permease